MKRWLLLAGVALAALLLLLVMATTWLLNTGGGRDLVLARVVSALPPGALAWERVDGRLAGPLVLHGVHYVHENGLEVRVQRVELDARVRALLGRHVDLHRVWLEGVDVQLAEPGEAAPAEPFSWPRDLPRLELPVSIQMRELGIRTLLLSDAARTPLLRVASLDASGYFGGARLELERLDVDSDRGTLHLQADLDTGRHYATGLAGSLHLPPPEGGDPVQGARFEVQLQGDLDELELVLEGQVPGPLRLDATFAGLDQEQPRWRMALEADGIDPRLFGADDATRVDVRLEAGGQGLAADVEGRVERDDITLDIHPSALAFDDGILELAPLDLGLFQGRVRIQGRAGLDQAQAPVDVQADITGVRYRVDPERPEVAVDGDLRLHGELQAWTVQGQLDFAHGEERARLDLQGGGDADSLHLTRFDARVPGGELAGTARLQWSPALAWEANAGLRRFDPGYFHPDFSGRIDARVRADGHALDTGGVRARLRIDELGGELRERALQGRADLDWEDGRGRVELDLGIGHSRIQGGGDIGDHLRLAFELEPLHLQDLLPGAAGQLRGRLALDGPAAAPDVAADLRGEDLRWGEDEVESLRVEGRLPGRGGRGGLVASLRGVVVSGIALASVEAQVDGTLSVAELGVQLRGDIGALELGADIEPLGDTFSGRLRALRYAPPRGAEWQLPEPAAFSIRDGRTQLDPACLVAAAARLCVQADWPRSATLEGRAIPLAMLEPWLAEDGLEFHVDGLVDLDGSFRQTPAGVEGELAVRSEGGGVRLASGTRREFIRYERLMLDAGLAAERLQATLDLRLAGDDQVRARLSTGTAADAALDGELELSVADLTFVELFSPDVVEPTGELSGRVLLGGTRAAPVVRGDAGLRGFGAELPALGIRLADSELLVRGDAGGVAVLEGELRSGTGRIAVNGRLAPGADGDRRIEIGLDGEDFLVADIPQLRAVVSPQLQITVEDTLHVRGRVEVPSARIDLELLETTTTPSRDVVVIDPVDPPGGPPMPVDALVTLVLGDRVELVGFGLDGRLAGELRVREVTGRATTATGALDVSGEYTAYGQDLSLQRGRLAWASSPVDNPSLDLVARRVVSADVTVGLRVRGTALQPTTELFSEPAMDNTEALSWLVLGRPLRTASGDEGQQLGAAALALGAGGNYVAEQLGARLGLDEAGVGESRALGGATFSVGKYLSPRLLVSYGVSLLGSGQVLTLKYLLGRGFDIEIESGTESRGALNWRLER